MGELAKNLAELSLLNSSELPPNPHLQYAAGKKIGPAVPPKPKKQPLVIWLFCNPKILIILSNFRYQNRVPLIKQSNRYILQN